MVPRANVAIRPIDARDIEPVAAKPAQGKGVGRMLWDAAKSACAAAGYRGAFTVNSSNNAVPIYERWGFRRAGPVQDSNGVIYNPMKLEPTEG